MFFKNTMFSIFKNKKQKTIFFVDKIVFCYKNKKLFSKTVYKLTLYNLVCKN